MQQGYGPACAGRPSGFSAVDEVGCGCYAGQGRSVFLGACAQEALFAVRKPVANARTGVFPGHLRAGSYLYAAGGPSGLPGWWAPACRKLLTWCEGQSHRKRLGDSHLFWYTEDKGEKSFFLQNRESYAMLALFDIKLCHLAVAAREGRVD